MKITLSYKFINAINFQFNKQVIIVVVSVIIR